MFLSTRTLIRPVTTELTVADLAAVLRATVVPGDGVEQLRVRASESGVHVVVRTRATDQQSADENTTTLCLRALAVHPALHGWRLG